MHTVLYWYIYMFDYMYTLYRYVYMFVNMFICTFTVYYIGTFTSLSTCSYVHAHCTV
jgi:hypothetical protein